jgi:hypothetical protein
MGCRRLRSKSTGVNVGPIRLTLQGSPFNNVRTGMCYVLAHVHIRT